jgi:hypothetical protein
VTQHGVGTPRDHAARFRSRAGRLLLASALCLVTLVPAPASAAPTAADRETARGLLKDGDTKFDSKDYRAALKNYEAAHSIMGYPSTGFAVAKTRAALGLLVEARDMALEVTRIPPKPGDPAAFARARESATKLAEELSRRIASLEITFHGGPESGEVALLLDGESVPVASLGAPRKANPGRHEVSASAPGFKSVSAHVDLAEGETKAVTLELEPEASAAAAPVAAAATTESTAEAEEPSGRRLSPLVYVGFGVGAAGLVTGTVTGILHLTKTSSVRDTYCNGGDECRPGFEDDRDAAKTYATIANIAFGVGIAGVAVGIVGLVTSKPGDGASVQAQSRPRIVPEIGLGSVSLRGIF